MKIKSLGLVAFWLLVPLRLAVASDLLTVDSGRVQAMRDQYRQAAADKGSDEDFWFAYLPSQIFSGILSGRSGAKGWSGDLGLLYESGYRGGVWLNRIISYGDRGIGFSKIMRALKPALFGYMNAKCRQRLKLIQSGGASKKLATLDKNLDLLVKSCGYNRGYLEELQKHPPAGSNREAGFLKYGEFLDCRYSGVELKALDGLWPVREKLSRPREENWRRLRERIAGRLPGSQAQGARVWRNLLSKREFSADSYQALLKISAQFLSLNEAIVLLSAQALVEQDGELAGRALAADAAFKVWMAGYLAGLSESK